MAYQDDPLERLKARKMADDPLERLKAARIAAQPPARPEMSRIGQIQGAAESAMDAATLGLSGLAGDFIASLGEPTLKELRAERRARRESVPSSVRVPIELAASMAAPVPGAGLLNLGRGYSLGGSLIKQAPQTAPLLTRTARAAGDAALQSGVAGFANSLDDLSGEGLMDAAGTGLLSAFLGAGVAGGLGSGTEMAVRGVRRIKGMGRLDKAAFKIVDDMAKVDAENYGTAAAEATTTPAIRDVMQNDAILAPLAKEIREEAAYQGRKMTDAQALMAAYRRVSSQQRRAQAALSRAKSGDVGYDPKLSEGTIENLGAAKQHALLAAEAPGSVVTLGRARTTAPITTAQSPAPTVREALDRYRLRSAEVARRAAPEVTQSPFVRAGRGETVIQGPMRPVVDRLIAAEGPGGPLLGQSLPVRAVVKESETIPVGPGIPSLRKAINVHRTKAGELDALQEGADVGLAAARNMSVRGNTFLTDSREAYLRKIPKMTNAEAEAALAGILGRFPEQASFTSSPLGLFGLVTSAVRAPLTTYRTMPIIRALEEKLGRGDMGQKAGDLVRGTSARYLGGLLGR